jgi:hypothetical protein
MRLAPALVLLAGCGANIINSGDPDDAAIDAPPPRPDAAVVVDAAVDAPVDARACLEGDARVIGPDGSCLFLLRAPKSFADAQTTCLGFGAHLAILTTAALDNAAETLAGNLDTFIGLSDQVTEGQFVWVDGTPLGFSNWEAGEPNNGGGSNEDCAIIAGARAEKKWDDRPCAPNGSGGAYAVLCQR